jgi:hypothetical protein
MSSALTCFGSCRNHPQGAVQYLVKNYRHASTVLVGMDVVNVVNSPSLLQFTCCHNIHYIHSDEHSRTMFEVFSQVLDSSLRTVLVWTGTCWGGCHNFNFNHFKIWYFILLSASVGTIKSFKHFPQFKNVRVNILVQVVSFIEQLCIQLF